MSMRVKVDRGNLQVSRPQSGTWIKFAFDLAILKLETFGTKV